MVLAVALAVVKGGLSHPLEKEWQTPLNVGDKVPDVTFATRTRIDADVEKETKNLAGSLRNRADTLASRKL